MILLQRAFQSPLAVVLGCCVGCLLLAAGVVAAETPTLRTGFVPAAFSVLSASFALAFAQAARIGVGEPRSVTRIAGFVAASGLAFVSVFFVALAALYLSGSSLLDNDDTALAALGTLLASIVALVVVSGAIALFGLGLWRDHRFPVYVRALPWAILGCVGAGLIAAAAASERTENIVQLPLWTLVAVLISLLSLRVYRDSRDVRSPGLAQNSPSVGP